MAIKKSGFIGNTKVQEELGEKAVDWLNEINQKMINTTNSDQVKLSNDNTF